MKQEYQNQVLFDGKKSYLMSLWLQVAILCFFLSLFYGCWCG